MFISVIFMYVRFFLVGAGLGWEGGCFNVGLLSGCWGILLSVLATAGSGWLAGRDLDFLGVILDGRVILGIKH